MDIGIAITIFLVFFAGIVALQFYYFKTDKKLLLIPAGVLGGLGGVVALMLSTYYNTALERMKTEVFFDTTISMTQFSEYQNYIIVCIFSAALLFGTIFFTALLPVLKKILIENGIINNTEEE